MPFSKGLNDNVVTDWEFQIINWELEKNFELKEAVHSKLKVTTGPGPDTVKLKQQLRNDVQGEFQKKILNAEWFPFTKSQQVFLSFMINTDGSSYLLRCFISFHTRMAEAGASNNQRSRFSSGRSEMVFFWRDL